MEPEIRDVNDTEPEGTVKTSDPALEVMETEDSDDSEERDIPEDRSIPEADLDPEWKVYLGSLREKFSIDDNILDKVVVWTEYSMFGFIILAVLSVIAFGISVAFLGFSTPFLLFARLFIGFLISAFGCAVLMVIGEGVFEYFQNIGR